MPQQPGHDRQRLFEPVDPVVERDAERSVLVRVVAGAEPQYRVAASGLVQGGHHVGEQQRGAIFRAADQRPERDPAGDSGEHGEQRPAIPEALRRLGGQFRRTRHSDLGGDCGRPPDQVIDRPQAIEPRFLDALGEGAEIGPPSCCAVELALAITQQQADLQRAAGARRRIFARHESGPLRALRRP